MCVNRVAIDLPAYVVADVGLVEEPDAHRDGALGPPAARGDPPILLTTRGAV